MNSRWSIAPSPKEEEQRKSLAAVEREPERSSKTIEPWATKWVRTLDEAIRIPGTRFHIGLDPILGLIAPGLGDALTGTGSIALLVLAVKHRVPTIAIARMALNIGIDTLLGAIPMLGDVFDLFFRSNRRNLAIIEKYRDDPKARASALDHVLVIGGVALVLVSIATPILLFYGLVTALVRGWPQL